LHFSAQRSEHSGREHRRQRGHQGGVLRIHLVGGTQRGRRPPARPQLHPEPNVLDQRRQRLVQQVQARNHEAAHSHRLPLARQVQGQRPHVQPARVRQRLQLPARLQNEPREKVRRLVEKRF